MGRGRRETKTAATPGTGGRRAEVLNRVRLRLCGNRWGPTGDRVRAQMLVATTGLPRHGAPALPRKCESGPLGAGQ